MKNESSITNENLHNSTVTNNVTQILAKSLEYHELLDQLKTQQKLFDRTPEDEEQERLEISVKINELTNRIKQFKEDVLRLAEQFNRIEINTDRLNRAKEHFDKGEIGEARAVLECEIEQIEDELQRLLIKKEEYENEILPKLMDKSNEFLILALSTQTLQDSQNWIENVCHYFDKSIEIGLNKYNLFEYAHFLDHKKPDEALTYYLLLIEHFTSDLSADWFPTIFNNIANAYNDLGKTEYAITYYKKALESYKQLMSTEYYQEYEFKYGDTLSNLGIAYSKIFVFEESEKVLNEAITIFNRLLIDLGEIAEEKILSIYCNFTFCFNNQGNLPKMISYSKKAYKLANKLYNKNPVKYAIKLATVLNSLGVTLDTNKELEDSIKCYLQSIEILSNLNNKNSFEHLSILATSYSNLAIVFDEQKKGPEASFYYLEAQKIYKELYKFSPKIFASDLCRVLANLSAFHLEVEKDFEKSVEFARQSLDLIKSQDTLTTEIMENHNRILAVLMSWGLNAEEIGQLIAEDEK